MGDAGALLPPPWQLVENADSLLDLTDLVFIDPVSTGYSRPVVGEKAKQFHGYKRDIESVGDFIRLYTSRYQRWSSPKFLIGESYGTTRAAGLSGYCKIDMECTERSDAGFSDPQFQVTDSIQQRFANHPPPTYAPPPA
jgi:carboxypeptidase C (cathepsin A)